MARVFLDSSALAKRYIEEHGSREVNERCRGSVAVVVSVIAPLEIISGLNRLRREKKLSIAQYKGIRTTLAGDISCAVVVPLDDLVIHFACRSLEKSALRALDAIHVASAKVSKCDLFISADRQQTLAASLAGLETELVG